MHGTVKGGKRQVSGMDLYHLQDCCTSCSAWFPRAGHVDMGRTIQVDLFRQHDRVYIVFRLSNTPFFDLPLAPFSRSFSGSLHFVRKKSIIHDVAATQALRVVLPH